MNILTVGTTGTRLLAAATLSILTLLSGLWLSRLGKPYNSWAFNLHKLIAVAAIFVIGINVFNLCRTLELQAFIVPAFIVLSGLLLTSLVVTGGLLSLNISPQISLRIHQAAPLLALAASAATLYMLIGNQA
jgi:hypothetical protein